MNGFKEEGMKSVKRESSYGVDIFFDLRDGMK